MRIFNSSQLLLSLGPAARLFSISASVFSLPNHKLYPKVDWERVEAGQYAIVDPINPGSILYLSEQDYIIMARVAITSNRTLKVLAEPGASKQEPTSPSSGSKPSSENSPPLTRAAEEWLEMFRFGNKTSTGRRGQKRGIHLFTSRLSQFAVRVNGTEVMDSLWEGILMVKLSDRNILQWFHTWHDQVSWWSRGSQLATVPRVERSSFGLTIRHLFLHQGVNALITRFKISLFVLNAYLGGRRLTTTEDLGMRIRLTNGLPAFLPLYVRDGIRHGNRHYIHIWSSVLFAYKGILGEWTEPRMDSSSIVQPHPPIRGTDEFQKFWGFCGYLWHAIQITYGLSFGMRDLMVKTPFFSTKAGPNSPHTIFGAGIDAYLWWLLDKFGLDDEQNYSLSRIGPLTEREAQYQAARQVTGVSRNYIREWLEATDQGDILLKIRKTAKMFALQYQLNLIIQGEWLVEILQNKTPAFLRNLQKGTGRKFRGPGLLPVMDTWITYIPEWALGVMGLNNRILRFKNPTLQRLHNLYEAAGKVRTIAIVDYWTNFVLKPLHDWMFKLLHLLPQDATFDQLGRVEEFSRRGYTSVYSYDLKSATDLIPFALYEALLSHILPERILSLWKDLLVNRDFLIPRSVYIAYPDHRSRVRYLTGQPMGALTSWAAMALVHHALVLYAAVASGAVPLAGVLQFRDYLVLGDDIVIANVQVAHAYLRLMKVLQIPVGLAKSHISHMGMFNFANKTFVSNQNVSPVSMREDLNANSLPTRIELFLRMVRQGWRTLESRTWMVSAGKMILPQKVWNDLRPLVAKRVTHPILNWIAAVLLTPGTTRFGFTGIRNVNLETFLASQLGRGRLWSTPLRSIYNILDRRRSDGLLISILGKWVNTVYQQFLTNRTRLKGFDVWVTRTVSVDIEWLFRWVFTSARQSALDRWVQNFRIGLKELQVATSLTAVQDRELFSHIAGKPWDEIVPWVAQAEAELPIVPDFSDPTSLAGITAASGGSDGGAARAEQEYRQQYDSLRRVISLLHMLDDLELSRTPGFVKPGNNSQSGLGDQPNSK